MSHLYAVEVCCGQVSVTELRGKKREELAEAVKQSHFLVQASSLTYAIKKAEDRMRYEAEATPANEGTNYVVRIDSSGTAVVKEIGDQTPQQIDKKLKGHTYFVRARTPEQAIEVLRKKDLARKQEKSDPEIEALKCYWPRRLSIKPAWVDGDPVPQIPFRKAVLNYTSCSWMP